MISSPYERKMIQSIEKEEDENGTRYILAMNASRVSKTCYPDGAFTVSEQTVTLTFDTEGKDVYKRQVYPPCCKAAETGFQAASAKRRQQAALSDCPLSYLLLLPSKYPLFLFCRILRLFSQISLLSCCVRPVSYTHLMDRTE